VSGLLELIDALIGKLKETHKPDRPYSGIPAFEYRHEFTNYEALLNELPEALANRAYCHRHAQGPDANIWL
jgi:hypothetical protein